MSSPRKLFKPIDIKAVSGHHSLLKDGKVPIIGYWTDKKRYTGGGCVIPKEVCFHFGSEYSDFFYFEDGTMIYQAITIKTPEYITDVYTKAAKKKTLSPDEFIEMVLDAYVMKELGF
jgi:hypothetical protein